MGYSTRQIRAQHLLNHQSSLLNLWILRILVLLGGHCEFLRNHGFSDDRVAHALGLGKWVDEVDGYKYDRKNVYKALRCLHVRAESRSAAANISDELARSMGPLAKLVGFSEVECRVFEFAVMIHTESMLDDVADFLGHLSSPKVYAVLATVLAQPECDIRTALKADSALARSSLLTLDWDGRSSLRSKLSILSSGFVERLLEGEHDPMALLRSMVNRATPALLMLEDYEHVGQQLKLLVTYLRKVQEARACGVNILLHGEPGTGKSQLCRLVAQELDCQLFEIACQDEAGDAAVGAQRMRAYRAAQSFFAQSTAMLLFDEVEDIFGDGGDIFGSKSTAQVRKGWVNKTLEENTIPAFWLTNSVRTLDPAFVRRFDMVIELSVPPRRQREKIIRSACGDMLKEKYVRHLSQSGDLAPAVVTRVAKVVQAIQLELPCDEIPEAVRLLVSSTLEAQGHPPLKSMAQDALPSFYDTSYLNSSLDLCYISEGLRTSKSGRICMYGPPGTGKTAFGYWLSEQLGQPLHVKRASDLLSMWVGESERNIAKAFREAEQDKAILLIDEVDSFLQDRQGASRSWEVTSVNEMLTQMEQFSGIFIASTNLMEGLDQACLRRFDLKIQFGHLEVEKAWRMFCCQCEAMMLGVPSRDLKRRIEAMSMLTPGDFAVITRQQRFNLIRSPEGMLEALEREHAAKKGTHRKALGF